MTNTQRIRLDARHAELSIACNETDELAQSLTGEERLIADCHIRELATMRNKAEQALYSGDLPSKAWHAHVTGVLYKAERFVQATRNAS